MNKEVTPIIILGDKIMVTQIKNMGIGDDLVNRLVVLFGTTATAKRKQSDA